MEYLIIGMATAFNFIILLWKVKRRRYEDATVDVTILAILSWIFGRTFSGMTVAMIASFFVSFYLLIFPPKLNKPKKES